MAEVGMKERRELLKVLWRCCRCQFVDRRPRITPGICELCKGNESEPVAPDFQVDPTSLATLVSNGGQEMDLDNEGELELTMTAEEGESAEDQPFEFSGMNSSTVFVDEGNSTRVENGGGEIAVMRKEEIAKMLSDMRTKWREEYPDAIALEAYMAGIDWRKQELGNSLPELFALKKTRNTDARRGLTVIRIGAHVMVGKGRTEPPFRYASVDLKDYEARIRMEKRLLSNEEPFSLGPVVLLMAKSFRYAYPDISGILEDHMADCQQCKEWRITVKVPWTQHKVLTPFTAVQLAVYGNKAIHGDYVSEGCKTHLDPFNVRGGVACIFRLQLDPRETRSGLRCKCKGGAGPYALHLPAATPPIIVTDGDATIILGDFLRRREDQHYVAPWNPHCQAHTPGRTMSVVAYMSKGVCTEGDKILLEANKFKGK